MVTTSIVCSACGSHTVPKDANFCPSCGKRILHRENENEASERESESENIPMVSAVPLASGAATATATATAVPAVQVPEHSSSVTTEASPVLTVTMDEACVAVNAPASRHSSSNANQYASTSTSTSTSEAAPATSSTTSSTGQRPQQPARRSHKVLSARYYANPPPQLIQQAARYHAMGGILFIHANNNGRYDGKWMVPETIHMGHILHGNHLDFSLADFIYPVTTITIGTILGGAKLIVPRGVRVETRGIGILGGFKGVNNNHYNDDEDDNGFDYHDNTTGTMMPLIVVQGMAILGGVKVQRNHTVPPLQVIP